jgi:hypothetical protein
VSTNVQPDIVVTVTPVATVEVKRRASAPTWADFA